MQKITEIKEYYTVKLRQKINGVEVLVDKKMSRYKVVNYVDGWARFGHYLLDIVFYLTFIFAFWFLMAVLTNIFNYKNVFESKFFKLIELLVNWIILYPAYYFLFEFTLQFSSGKAILKRIVVDEYGNKRTVKQIFILSISLCVPLEVFFCFGRTGWHDDWSDTFVLRRKDFLNLKLARQINAINPALL